MSNSPPIRDGSLRIAFLVGNDSRETREPLETVCAIEGVTPCAILLDTQQRSPRVRLRNLRRSIRRNGWAYITHGLLRAVRLYTDRLVEKSVLRPGEVLDVVRRSFPERNFTLDDAGKRYGVPVQRVGNLNGPTAIAALRECGADLAVVLGTRILKPEVFTIPVLGSINLHKGKVPRYRGIPPGYWELYEGAPVAGVTVHFIDRTIDTGDVIETGEVSIAPLETPESLGEKLHGLGVRVLVRAVSAILAGTAVRKPQTNISAKPHTHLTVAEMATLRSRLPHWKPQPASRVILENLLYLTLFHTGIYYFLKSNRKPACAATILYRPLHDHSGDLLSVDTETFAAQLLVIAKHYRAVTSGEMVRLVRSGANVPPSAVIIHFEEGNCPVREEGLRILQTLGIPGETALESDDVDRRSVAVGAVQDEISSRQVVQRWIGTSSGVGEHRVDSAAANKPLWLMMEIEKCSVRGLAAYLRKLLSSGLTK